MLSAGNRLAACFSFSARSYGRIKRHWRGGERSFWQRRREPFRNHRCFTTCVCAPFRCEGSDVERMPGGFGERIRAGNLLRSRHRRQLCPIDCQCPHDRHACRRTELAAREFAAQSSGRRCVPVPDEEFGVSINRKYALCFSSRIGSCPGPAQCLQESCIREFDRDSPDDAPGARPDDADQTPRASGQAGRQRPHFQSPFYGRQGNGRTTQRSQWTCESLFGNIG